MDSPEDKRRPKLSIGVVCAGDEVLLLPPGADGDGLCSYVGGVGAGEGVALLACPPKGGLRPMLSLGSSEGVLVAGLGLLGAPAGPRFTASPFNFGV